VSGRLVHSADFQRVLATVPKVRSAHFAAHHLQQRPTAASRGERPGLTMKISTVDATVSAELVDKLSGEHWLGLVVPKRLARRAVTRQLVKRQMREALRRHADRLGAGLWVLRLQRGFDARRYPSAASAGLRCELRVELDALLARAAG
jgi:ribonuclease P protein component